MRFHRSTRTGLNEEAVLYTLAIVWQAFFLSNIENRRGGTHLAALRRVEEMAILPNQRHAEKLRMPCVDVHKLLWSFYHASLLVEFFENSI